MFDEQLRVSLHSAILSYVNSEKMNEKINVTVENFKIILYYDKWMVLYFCAILLTSSSFLTFRSNLLKEKSIKPVHHPNFKRSSSRSIIQIIFPFPIFYLWFCVSNFTLTRRCIYIAGGTSL